MLLFLPSVHTTLMCEDNYECDSAGTARLDSETYVPLSNHNHYQISRLSSAREIVPDNVRCHIISSVQKKI